MFRWGLVRVGTATGAAAAAAVGTNESHARVRPTRIARRVSPVLTANEAGSEDGWLPFSLEGEDVIFGPEEVKEAIDDVLGIANGGKTEAGSDTESVESIGVDADAVIASSATFPMGTSQGTGMQLVASFTENLLGRTSMQIAMIEAMDQDPSIRVLFRDLFGPKDGRVQVFECPSQTSFPALLNDDSPDPEGAQNALNVFDTILHKIVHGFGAAGKFLGKVGNWLKTRLQKEDPQGEDGRPLFEDDSRFGEQGKLSGAVLYFASVVMLLMVAKRLGFLKIMKGVVP